MEEKTKPTSKEQSTSEIKIKNKLTNKEINVPTGLFINNEFTSSSDNAEMEIINPSNEEMICKVSCASEKDADKAIEAAFKAYFGPWGKLTGDERGKLIFKLADLFEKSISDFAYLESLDNGKILRDSIDDMEEALKYMRYYGGWADKIEGKSYPCAHNFSMTSRRIPYGVVGLISPWNYPLLMCSWKIFPAIAAGNTIVLKPSEETPLTSLKLAELFLEAGFPAGVVNIIPGYGNTVGTRITSHSKVRKVSFTCATRTGRDVMKKAAESNLKNVHLELGGKSALIVCDDADLENALNFAIDGAFRNTSQNCACSARILAQEGIYKEFVDKFIKKTEELKVGDAFEKENYMGPLISKKQIDSVTSFINHGLKEEKLKLATGGKKIFEKGFFLEPTVFTYVPDESKLVKEEIFGPVICILKPFKDIQEAIDRANNSDYGLAAAIFSKDPDKIELFSRQIQAGTVWINMCNYCPFNVPFGGVKQSGFGRDNGYEAILENTTLKSVFQAFNFEHVKKRIESSEKASTEIKS
jgi:aldehyde dehydrogenase (NAD+)